MATGFWADSGNPAAYKRSDIWDTDYGQKAYNSYNDYTGRMKKFGTQYLSGRNPLSHLASRVKTDFDKIGNKYGGIGRWGAGYAAPDDPAVGGYMNNLRGGRYNMLNDYSKSMANAGVSAGRGGFGVSGGSPIDSRARLEAMQTGARQYGDDYSKSMDWAGNLYGGIKDLYSKGLDTQLGALTAAGNIGVNLADAERQGIAGANSMFGMRREDFNADRANQMAWEQGRPGREREQADWEYQRRLQQLQQEKGFREQALMDDAYLSGPDYRTNIAQLMRLRRGGLGG